MPKIFCYIPQSVLAHKPADTTISAFTRQVLDQALRDKSLHPQIVGADAERLTIDLDDKTYKQLDEVAQKEGIAIGRVAGGLCLAYMSQAHTSTEPVIASKQSILSAIQQQCIDEAYPLLCQGKVVAAEYGTGTGKSRIISMLAYLLHKQSHTHAVSLPNNPFQYQYAPINTYIEMVRSIQKERSTFDQHKAVIISTLSIENLLHLCKEWSLVTSSIDGVRPNTAVALGRNQFVSKERLLSLLETEPESAHKQEVQRWIEAGMPCGLTPSTSILLQIEPHAKELMADLEHVARLCSFNPKDAALEDDCTPGEDATYEHLRSKAQGADILFTTHAMLCMDTLLLGKQDRKALLPQAAALLIDEAHAIDSVLSTVAGSSLSFHRLSADLSHKLDDYLSPTAVKEARNSLQKLTHLLSTIPDETELPIPEDHLQFHTWKAAKAEFKKLSEALQKIGLRKKIATSPPSEIPLRVHQAIRYMQRCCQAINLIQNDFRGLLTHSPVLGKVNINIGPMSVARHHAARWETSPCVMLLSGTLLHSSPSGVSSGPLKKTLALPETRLAVMAPVHPHWLTSSPELWTPSKKLAEQLTPPTIKTKEISPQKFEEALDAWIDSVAQHITLATDTAKGGTLVLMTSFDKVKRLAKKLEPQLQERLIASSPDTRSSVYAAQFRAHKDRPVWIATGMAWTGLDLSEPVPAYKDFMLTDLVIPAIPFGLDRSLSHMSRTHAMGFQVERVEAVRRFRQGLGRLIRREGLLKRRLWVLDGRLFTPSHMQYTHEMRALLKKYVHRKEF